MIVCVSLNIAFISFQQTSFQAPWDGVLDSVVLNLTGYSDGVPTAQTRAGLFPFNPLTALPFVDNRSPFALLGFNSTATAGVPITLIQLFPIGIELQAGRLIYFAGSSDNALGGSAYASLHYTSRRRK